MHRTCLTILFLLAGRSLAVAQSNAVYPPPTGSLVALVPENAEWILSVSDDKNQPVKPEGHSAADSLTGPKSINLKEIHVTKMGTVKRDIFTYSNGTTVENWYVNGAFLSSTGDGGVSVIESGALAGMYGNALGNPQQSPGFSGIDWLSLKYYDKVVLYHGELCYHYAIKVPGAPSDNMDLPTDQPIQRPLLSAEAWIDVKTRQPAAYLGADGKLYAYHFLGSPAASLTLPPAYEVMLATYEKAQAEKKRLEEAATAFQRH